MDDRLHRLTQRNLARKVVCGRRFHHLLINSFFTRTNREISIRSRRNRISRFETGCSFDLQHSSSRRRLLLGEVAEISNEHLPTLLMTLSARVIVTGWKAVLCREVQIHERQLSDDLDCPSRRSFMIVIDQGFRGNCTVHVNATSTRIRRFGAAGGGENRSMSAGVGMENARNQRLGV